MANTVTSRMPKRVATRHNYQSSDTMEPMGPRRSSRISGRKETKPVVDAENIPPLKRKAQVVDGSRKRSKTSSLRDVANHVSRPSGEHKLSRTQMRKQRLTKLPGMPIDVLFEIFSNLHPLDLLRLSRSTRGLRGVIMSRTSVTVWERALSNIPGLPKCPCHMSHPQFVEMIFVKTCFYCDRRTTGLADMLWAGRTRTCFKCFQENFVNWDHLDDYYASVKLPAGKDATVQASSGHQVKVTELLLPFAGIRYKKRFFMSWLEADVLKMVDRLKMIQDDEGALNTFLDEQMARAKQASDECDACIVWSNNEIKQHFLEKEAARDRRREFIKAKLTALGFEEELEWMGDDDLDDHPIIGRRQDISEASWRKIEPRLVEEFSEHKIFRIEEEKLLVKLYLSQQLYAQNPFEGT